MVYVLIIFLLAVGTLLLSRLRIRVKLTPETRILFLGLGRTGPEFDFVTRMVRVRLFGVDVRKLPMSRGGKKKATTPAAEGKLPGEVKEPQPKKRRSLRLLLAIINQSGRAVWHFVLGIFKGIIVEEAEGELTLGFESPDVTGQVYGCYAAVAGIVPAIGRRFTLVPNFAGSGFSGRLHASVALPVYVLVWRVAILIAQLPIRKIIQYSRGKTKGAEHGEQ